MNRRVALFLLLLLLPAVLLLLPGRFAREARLQEPTAIIDPALLNGLQREAEVEVLISLKPPDIPLAEQTTEIRRQNAAERQARVPSVLTPSDFTLTHQFEIAAALGGLITESGVQKLASHPDVVAVTMTGKGSWALSQSVPLINANAVIFQGVDGTGVDVAVLDSGIDTDHPDLIDSIIGQECFRDCDNGTNRQSGPGSAEDQNGHGTHVSGIITSDGDNDIASVGVAPKAGVFAYKVGTAAPNEIAVLDALEDIEARGFTVEFVNMSLVFSIPLITPCANVIPAIEGQIDVLLFEGILSFAASGNAGDKARMPFPACYSSVVSVGAVYDANIGQYVWPLVCTDATTAADKVACWSNSSDDLELLAPGCEIRSTARGGGEEPRCGTSMAAPHAVGVAALLRQSRPDLWQQLFPGAGALEALSRMKSTGRWVKDDLANRWTQRIDARVAFLVDDNADFDQDGCTNGTEFGTDEMQGGLRNPLNSGDFYDTNGDTTVDLPNDIVGVISR